MIRREAVSFANLKTFVPCSPFGARFLAMAFRSDVWFLPIARDIEAYLLWDSPSRASFGKVGSIMKRLCVPIDRHADGQARRGASEDCACGVPYRRLMQLARADGDRVMRFLLLALGPV
jgi:hypothetical protein